MTVFTHNNLQNSGKIMQYPIAIFQKDSCFFVNFPDIPMLEAQGNNMAEAVSNARMALIHHLHQLMEEEANLPQPTPVSNHLIKPEYAGYTWAIVGIELARIKGEQVELNVQIAQSLYQQLLRHDPNESLDKIVSLALKRYLQTPSN
ncbi:MULTISPECIES: type II toxin-antitoxin system HicB family antitoxin [unclassified Moraxella]|uniref:type II toxin-antitoxin system HicB family antitoxin n=1 Tax=unclassified Moraxella TaxID=2685852 RepID=UPI003AF57EBF